MTTKRALTMTLLAPLLVAVGLVTTGGAHQSTDNEAAPSSPMFGAISYADVVDTADRVIEKLDQRILGDQPDISDIGTAKMNINGATTATSVTRAKPIPADENPRQGETVLVQYADATVVHQETAAGCTVTVTAGNPYKSSSTRVSATTSYSQSGCTNIEQARGALEIYWGFEWVDRSAATYVPTNGALHTQYLGWACNNSNISPFRSSVANKYSGISRMYTIAVSPTKNLACG